MHSFLSIRKHGSAVDEKRAVTLLLQKRELTLTWHKKAECVSAVDRGGKSFPLHPPASLFFFHGLTNVSWSVSEPQLSKFLLKDESCVRKLIARWKRYFLFCFLNTEDLHFFTQGRWKKGAPPTGEGLLLQSNANLTKWNFFYFSKHCFFFLLFNSCSNIYALQMFTNMMHYVACRV